MRAVARGVQAREAVGQEKVENLKENSKKIRNGGRGYGQRDGERGENFPENRERGCENGDAGEKVARMTQYRGGVALSRSH